MDLRTMLTNFQKRHIIQYMRTDAQKINVHAEPLV